MKTATVRELRNHYNTLLEWVAMGEEVVITKRGKSVARLVPELPEKADIVDWSQSVAMRDLSPTQKTLTDAQVKEIFDHIDG
ncbi:MAG: type II toxin-antitoxin system prevent-host-death family antitoxin [Luteolibacter sp.]